MSARIRFVMVMVGIFGPVMALTSCAEEGGMSDDDRYEYCVSHGGSFDKGDDYDEWSCTMPAERSTDESDG